MFKKPFRGLLSVLSVLKAALLQQAEPVDRESHPRHPARPQAYPSQMSARILQFDAKAQLRTHTRHQGAKEVVRRLKQIHAGQRHTFQPGDGASIRTVVLVFTILGMASLLT